MILSADSSALLTRITRWVRRRRRIVAACLAAVGVLVMMTALMPREAATTQVFVAARDLMPGEFLSGEAITEVQLPMSAIPPGAVRSPEEFTGRIITGPVAAGEVITVTRLLTSGSAGEGRVGVPIRLADQDIAALLAPGDVVDVVAILEGTARRLATGARVVTVPRRVATFGSGSGSGLGAGLGSSSTTGAVVIVAVAPESALTLASVTTPTGIILRSGALLHTASATSAAGR